MCLETDAKRWIVNQRKEYRIEHVKPILEDLRHLQKTALEVTPKVRSAKL